MAIRVRFDADPVNIGKPVTVTWTNAALRGLLIVLYFVVATVWLPDRVLRLGAVAESSAMIRDLLVLVVWGAGLVGGLWMMRTAQRRGLI